MPRAGSSYVRPILKPVAGTVRVAVAGDPKVESIDWSRRCGDGHGDALSMAPDVGRGGDGGVRVRRAGAVRHGPHPDLGRVFSGGRCADGAGRGGAGLMTGAEGLHAHLATAVRRPCAGAWAVLRRDGRGFGFTDHDRDLTFDGIAFRADTGMTARALDADDGAVGRQLGSDGRAECSGGDRGGSAGGAVRRGRSAGVAGQLGVGRASGCCSFAARWARSCGRRARSGRSLRGLTEALNQPQRPGRISAAARRCWATGSAGSICRRRAMRRSAPVETLADRRLFRFAAFGGFAERWFETGAAGGAVGCRGRTGRADQERPGRWTAAG